MINQLAKELSKRNLTLSVAESCTAGGLAHSLTSVSGSSAYFAGGIVAYSNLIKSNLLNVSPEDLDQYGAVSEVVAGQMAKGVQALLHTNVSISTTGIAGPGGGTEEKPVGTVCFGFSVGEQCMTATQRFSGDRGQVRQMAIDYAISFIYSYLLKNTV